MGQINTTLEYRISTLSGVLLVGGLIGIIDPIICWGVPPRTLLAFAGGLALWTILPFLRWTRDVRSSMILAVAATFLVFQGCFVIYGDPFYIMLGFAVPVAAALFMSAFDASVVLAVYSVTAVLISVIIWSEWWIPPHLVDGADVAVNVKQTITGVAVIVAIAASTIWKEQLFAGPTQRERTQQVRYEIICDNGYDAILEADEHGFITFASGQLLRDLGYSMDELIGAHQLELICAGYRAEFLRGTRIEHGEYKYDLETRVVDADSKPHWVRISGGSFSDDRGKQKWIHGVRSIDEQVSQRQRFFEISRLESLGTVCGGIAHDFNNLLTVIGIHAGQIADEDVQQKILQAQLEATELTSGLLAFSRKQDYREKRVQLADFLTEAQPLVEKIAKENVRFTWQVRCKEAVVVIDPSQLQQIIINLVSNADHSMPNGGQLDIVAEETDSIPDAIRDRLDEPLNRYVVLSISDDGDGMSQEVQARAYEPFFTTKPRGKGTGLGLAMVHGIVKNAGGAIAISSQIGKGTTVFLFLPIHSQIKNEVPSPHFRLQKSAAKIAANVLLVEDRKLLGQAIQKGLELDGAKAILFGTAEDAWDHISNGNDYDIIVTDLVLPGMSGVELIEKAIEFNCKTKAILMSGYQQQEIRIVQAYPDNVRFVPKPFRPNQLVDLIKKLLKITSERAKRPV